MPMSQAMWRSQSISVSPRRPSDRGIKFSAWSATGKSGDFANFGGSLSLIEY